MALYKCDHLIIYLSFVNTDCTYPPFQYFFYEHVVVTFIYLGYHNRLAEKSDRHKQLIWVIIRTLKDDERLILMAARRMDMGFEPPVWKLKDRHLEKKN